MRKFAILRFSSTNGDGLNQRRCGGPNLRFAAGWGLLLLALAAGGCRRETPAEAIRPAEADAAFAKGGQAYLSGDWAGAERAFASVQAASTDERQVREAAYWRGASLLELGRAREAAAVLRPVAGAAEGEFGARAWKCLAQAYARTGDYRAAEAIYQKLLRRSADYIDRGEVLAALAACKHKRGDEAGAAEIERELAANFPGSLYRAGVSETGGASTPVGAGARVVQCGAFSTQSLAEAQRDRLRSAGFAAEVLPYRGSGAARFVVQTGAYASAAAAEREAARLKARGFEAVVK